jgi:hypothetical protein
MQCLAYNTPFILVCFRMTICVFRSHNIVADKIYAWTEYSFNLDMIAKLPFFRSRILLCFDNFMIRSFPPCLSEIRTPHTPTCLVLLFPQKAMYLSHHISIYSKNIEKYNIKCAKTQIPAFVSEVQTKRNTSATV